MARGVDHADPGLESMNAITAFVADAVVYGPGYSFQRERPKSGPACPGTKPRKPILSRALIEHNDRPLIYSLAALSFCWFLLLAFLKGKRVFIKV